MHIHTYKHRDKYKRKPRWEVTGRRKPGNEMEGSSRHRERQWGRGTNENKAYDTNV